LTSNVYAQAEHGSMAAFILAWVVLVLVDVQRSGAGRHVHHACARTLCTVATWV